MAEFFGRKFSNHNFFFGRLGVYRGRCLQGPTIELFGRTAELFGQTAKQIGRTAEQIGETAELFG